MHNDVAPSLGQRRRPGAAAKRGSGRWSVLGI